MNKTLEVVNLDKTLTNNMKNYTNFTSNSGIKILEPAGKNYKNQMLWWCKCGYCKNIFIDIPARVLNGHKKSCGCLKSENCTKRKIEVKYSFYKWCVDNNHKDWIALWDYDMNNVSPNMVSYKSSKSYWFKCSKNNEHKSEKHKILNITKNNHLICNQCNSFAQWCIENVDKDFLSKYWDYNKNTENPYEISYGSNKKVWIKCQERQYHGSYAVSCNKFSIGNCRCPYCNKNSGKVHKLDSLGYLYPDVLQVWSDLNKMTPYEYSPQTNKKVWFKCKNGKHDDYLQIISNAVNRDFRCPSCVKEEQDSILQTKVVKYISEKYNYTILHEQHCSINPKNPKTQYRMPYDNEVLELKLIIEVNGEQHYKPTQFIKLNAKRNGVSIEEQFKERQYKDNYKKQYALSHGYSFLEIPYTSIDNDEYKKMIDDKIKEIIETN